MAEVLTMAASALISASEYLTTTYRPDCDFVDGEVQERNLGEYDHNKLQFAVAKFFDGMSLAWKIDVIPEQRVQVSATRFRVPDICVMSAAEPVEQIVRHTPLLCVEILSPEDTVSRMRERIADFLTMGVPQVWILDPKARVLIVCEGDTTVEHRTGDVSLPGTPIRLSLAEIFKSVDKRS